MSALPAEVTRQIEDALDGATENQLLREVGKRLANGRLDVDEWAEAFGFDEDAPEIESPDRLEEARCRLMRGEHREALYHLLVALGGDFSRLADIRPETLK